MEGTETARSAQFFILSTIAYSQLVIESVA